MNCPKCNSMMEKVEYQSIEIDRCTNCYGIWFDMLEAEHLKEMKGYTYSEIAHLLNRDERTIWTAYSRVKKKRKKH